MTTANPGQLQRGPTIADPRVARSLHTTSLVTPEAVLLEFRSAGVGSRLLAKGVDLIIQFVLVIVAAIGLGVMAASTSALVATVMAIIVITGILIGYPLIEVVDGQTIGKRIFGLRVITVEGGPVRFSHAMIRALIWIPEFLIPIPGGFVALAAALLTRRGQRIGDLAAGTLVVRTHKAASAPTFVATTPQAADFARRFDSSRLSHHDYALIREFFARINELTITARSHVGGQLADQVAERTGQPRPFELAPENYLMAGLLSAQMASGSSVTPPPPGPASQVTAEQLRNAPPPSV